MRNALLLSCVPCLLVLIVGCHKDEPRYDDVSKPVGETVDLTRPAVPSPATQPVSSEVNPVLFGTNWTLTEIDGQPAMMVQGFRAPTIQFDQKESRAFGSTGINRFSAGFAVDGSSLTFKPGPMTKMAGPDLLMRQEQKVMDVLQTTTAYRIDGTSTLELLAGEKVIAKYMALPPEEPK